MRIGYPVHILINKEREIRSILRNGRFKKTNKIFDPKNGPVEYTSPELEQMLKELKTGIRILKALEEVNE